MASDTPETRPDGQEIQVAIAPGSGDDSARGPFLQAMSRQMNLMRHVYPDQANVSLDFLFVTYLSLCARFGRFSYGPVTLECRVVEDMFERTYRRVAGGEEPGGYDESANRFYRKLSEEMARSKRRRIDELHWLLAFMRVDEGLPARVFGELGVTPEQVERFAAGEVALPKQDSGRGEPKRTGPQEKLYSPEEVADYLGVHVQTVRVWIRSGKLPARRLAGQRALRIRESDLDAVLEPLDHGEDSQELPEDKT